MNSPQAIEVHVDLRMGELYHATFIMLVRALRHLLVLLAVLVVLCGTGLLYGFLGGPLSGTAEGIGLFLFPFLEGGVPTTVVMIPLISYVRVRQVLRAEAMSLTRRYTFSEGGVDIKSPEINAQALWSAVREVRESRRFFYLYFIPSMANILPKRCFANGTNLDGFRAMVRANVKKTQLNN